MPTLVCPICHRTVSFTSREDVPYRPFCSPRCQRVDLGMWLNEAYRVTEEFSDVEPGEAGSADPDRSAGDE